MGAWTLVRSLNRDQRSAFIASFLGWTLDAFDYFVVTFVVIHIAADFKQAVATVTLAITVTLAMRWLGALIFGILADRFGRRLPLMIDILFYSVIELITAFSPNFAVFFVLRALYGIGMGGEWGVGASLAMESLPTESRGFFSGLLQEGYSCGYLLAAIAFYLVYPNFGWRPLFVIGVLPALLVIFIRLRVRESPVWEQRQEARQPLQQTPGAGGAPPVKGRGRRLVLLYIYAILLMSAFNYMSHGTQDLYPTFLEAQRKLQPGGVTIIAIIYNVGAIIGGMLFGYYSQRWGRRRSIIIAAALGIVVIPLWVFSPTTVLLAVGAFLMQFFVQGAWGVIPIHLNEISPGGARGTFPGFTYQLGNVISAPAAFLEAHFADSFFKSGKTADYAKAQAVLALIIFLLVIFFTAIGRIWIGHEKRGIDFVTDEEEPEGTARAPAAHQGAA